MDKSWQGFEEPLPDLNYHMMIRQMRFDDAVFTANMLGDFDALMKIQQSRLNDNDSPLEIPW